MLADYKVVFRSEEFTPHVLGWLLLLLSPGKSVQKNIIQKLKGFVTEGSAI